ncbi:cytochrome P450 [Roridomyces roridus]|uniref:Cytochrome P450 n=1 Tax=Roridomyces roridus TaxID=1738132 RepID=A0AAD7FAG5_9AGAR|nr:cytochrome P450 [Roridomyces roridus]
MLFSIVVFLLLTGAFVYLRKIGARDKDLPPGPPTLPIIGNLHLLPKESSHFKFTEWARQYGGIYSLKVGPGTVIVVTDPTIVKELLEKRSATTSDRPAMYIVDQITGGFDIAFARYGDEWRTLRKTAHAILTPQAATRHLAIQRAEATQLLHDILTSPQDFYTHVRRYTISVIMSVLYGQRVPHYGTPETIAFFEMMHLWTEVLAPGAAPPLDLLPIFKLVPERWAKWRQTVRKIQGLMRPLFFGLLDAAEERIRSGVQNECYVEEILEKQADFGLDRKMIAYFAGTLIEGATETTASYLHSFILCMIAYPEAQRKAQEEIDRVVGQDRLPNLDDRLPYVQALILETHRFRPVSPMFVPHATTASERYNDYVIPSGSAIFANAWGMLHDPALFEDPEDFRPERYLLTENGTKPGVDASDMRGLFAFGVGRRSCPGIHLAQNSIHINVMNLIWAFDFKPVLDSHGNNIQPDTWAYSKGISFAPLPFDCLISPRTSHKARIIRQEFSESATIFERFEHAGRSTGVDGQ